MALITCSECGKEFSDKAPACPNCGCPTCEISISNINSFDDVFEANKALQVLGSSSMKATKESLLKDENVLFSSILNIAIAPNNRKLSNDFFPKGKKINGVLTITNDRVLFISIPSMYGERKELAIKDITSIDSKRTVFNCPVRIKGLTEMFIIDCNKDAQEKILHALQVARSRS